MPCLQKYMSQLFRTSKRTNTTAKTAEKPLCKYLIKINKSSAIRLFLSFSINKHALCLALEMHRLVTLEIHFSLKPFLLEEVQLGLLEETASEM